MNGNLPFVGTSGLVPNLGYSLLGIDATHLSDI
jgi:hypothetical protein